MPVAIVTLQVILIFSPAGKGSDNKLVITGGFVTVPEVTVSQVVPILIPSINKTGPFVPD